MPDFIPHPPESSKPGSYPPGTAIPIALPPWTLKAKAWTFLYRDRGKNVLQQDDMQRNPNNAEEILQGILPPGAYHPFETVHPAALRKVDEKSQYRQTWLKGVLIIRYEDTNVGPYDELILIPGRAVNPHTGKKHFRISTIYVSTDASVWNGRRNWNIPKHRARFEFTPVRKSDLALKVYHPDDSPAARNPDVPFFTAVLRGSSVPKIPLPTLAPIPIVQPPLSRPRYPPGTQEAVIATDDPENGRENPWLSITPSFKGKWGLAYARRLAENENDLKWHGDGIGFPKVKFWSLGASFEGTVGFGVSQVAS